MRTAFLEALLDAAAADERIWLLSADLGYSVLEPFIKRYPDRFVNVGVAEQNLIGVAAGLAHSGLRPFVYSIANFPTLRCLEQIRNDVCYHDADVKIVAVGGGLAYGPQGYTHHGVEDIAAMRCLPGMTVVSPADPIEARLATDALARHRGPSYLRLGKSKEPLIHLRSPKFELGKAIVVRPGKDLTLIATGGILGDALAAAETLARGGMQARVISMPTVKPLDAAAVRRAAKQTGGIITVEEHGVIGGLGSAVADVLAETGIGIPFRKLGIPDHCSHLVGSQGYLKQHLIGDIATAALRLVGRRAAPRLLDEQNDRACA